MQIDDNVFTVYLKNYGCFDNKNGENNIISPVDQSETTLTLNSYFKSSVGLGWWIGRVLLSSRLYVCIVYNCLRPSWNNILTSDSHLYKRVFINVLNVEQ